MEVTTQKIPNETVTEEASTVAASRVDHRSKAQVAYKRLQAHCSILVLFVAFFLGQYDKFILSYFQLDITKELDISSSQYAILSGYATGISYAILAVPVAYISDHSSARVWALAASVIWWSLCVLFQGLSRTYWQLICSRVGMGIGQSAAEALCVSLISDLMGAERYVTSGEGILYVGIYIGEAISGQISTAFRKTNTSWRWAMKGVGFFGIGVGVLVRIILYREPSRRERFGENDADAEVVDGAQVPPTGKPFIQSIRNTIRHVVQMRSFAILALSAGLRTMSGLVFGYYMPGYLQQLYPHTENIMSIYGIIVGAVGSTAALLGGFITTALWSKTKLTPLYLVSIGGTVSSLFVLLMIFSRDISGDAESGGTRTLYGVMTAAYITAELWLGPVNGLVVLMVPLQYKTFAFSIYSSLVVLISSSGPEIVGLALRGVNPESSAYVAAIKAILAVIIPVGYLLSSVGFAICIPVIKRDLANPLGPGHSDSNSSIPLAQRVKVGIGLALIIIMVVVLFAMNIAFQA